MKKVTAVAPANIALIKYWGMQDEGLTLPVNPSLSMTLRECVSTCTVAARDDAIAVDEVLWAETDGCLVPATGAMREGILRQAARLRSAAGVSHALKIATTNAFPTGAGIASSASGFAALTMALGAHLGWPADDDALSCWARLSGSGSAARSIHGGFVEWPGDACDPASPARRLFAAAHWSLCDLIVIVDPGPKDISSREGHRRASSSPYFAQRQALLPARAERLRAALAERNFERFAVAVEEEAIDLHLIAMSASPPCFYWQPATVGVLAAVRQWRKDGVLACSTIDAGANVHVLCLPAEIPRLRDALGRLPGVHAVLVDRVGEGPVYVDEHLF